MATKTIKASARGGVTVKATASKVAKRNNALGKLRAKPMYADKGAHKFWATLATVAKGSLIPSDLRTATIGNAQARRQWCADNGAVLVDAREVCRKVSLDRADNAVRARLAKLAEVDTTLGKVGYVRAIATPIAKANPDHALAYSVYLYRTK